MRPYRLAQLPPVSSSEPWGDFALGLLPRFPTLADRKTAVIVVIPDGRRPPHASPSRGRGCTAPPLKPEPPRPQNGVFMAAKFSPGDEISMWGTVSIVHDEEHGRQRVTVRLRGYDSPITVEQEYVALVARAEKPKRPSRRKGPLFDVPD